jgi:hypothetical protein
MAADCLLAADPAGYCLADRIVYQTPDYLVGLSAEKDRYCKFRFGNCCRNLLLCNLALEVSGIGLG